MIEDAAPLASFILLAYNQESFIRDAIEGALSQTYSPLEIIISDDCSTDSTFQLIQEIATSYIGPHRIILNKNDKNLGIGSHMNRAGSLASGELIVAAGGDDISLPMRVQTLMGTWLAAGKPAVSIHSAVILMDLNGESLGTFRLNDRNCRQPMDIVDKHVVLGASHAWSHQVFATFGDLLDCVTYEDRAISFRSSLLDGLLYVHEPLVKYRIGGSSNESSDSNRDVFFRRKKQISSILYCDAVQLLSDCDKTGMIKSDPVRIRLEQRKQQFSIEVQMASGAHPIPLLFKNRSSVSVNMLKLGVIYCAPATYWKFWHSRSTKNVPVTAVFDTVGCREL